MPNTTFSFQKAGTSDKVKGTELTFDIYPIWAAKPVAVFDAGLILMADKGPMQYARLEAPTLSPLKDYTFNTSATRTRKITESVENIVIINKAITQVLTSEKGDLSLWDAAGRLVAATISQLGEQARRVMALDYYKAVVDVLKLQKSSATPANLKILSQATVDGIGGPNDDSLAILDNISDTILAIASQIDKKNFGIPKDQIVVLVSPKFKKLVRKCYAALGRAPEYIRIGNDNEIYIEDVLLKEDIFLGSNVPAGVIHTTKTIDLTNFWAVIVQKQALSFIAGHQEMWDAIDPYDNNNHSGIKSFYGFKVWEAFKGNIYGIIKDKSALPS